MAEKSKMADFYLLTSTNLIAKTFPAFEMSNCTIKLQKEIYKQHKMAEIRQMAPSMFFTFPLMSPVALNRF
jgi:hypothetical protein